MALGQTVGCPRVNRAQKVYVFASKHRKYTFFPLVNRRVVPGLSRFSKSLCVQSLFMDLFMGLFRGAVFRHGGGALKTAH